MWVPLHWIPKLRHNAEHPLDFRQILGYMVIKWTFRWVSVLIKLCARHSNKHFTFFNSFNSHKHHQIGSTIPILWRENWYSERQKWHGQGDKVRIWNSTQICLATKPLALFFQCLSCVVVVFSTCSMDCLRNYVRNTPAASQASSQASTGVDPWMARP